jgi:hypothetical protein
MSITGNTGIPKLIKEDKSKLEIEKSKINSIEPSATIQINPFDDNFSLSSRNEIKTNQKIIVDLNKIVDSIVIENRNISTDEKVDIAKIIDRVKLKCKTNQEIADAYLLNKQEYERNLIKNMLLKYLTKADIPIDDRKDIDKLEKAIAIKFVKLVLQIDKQSVQTVLSLNRSIATRTKSILNKQQSSSEESDKTILKEQIRLVRNSKIQPSSLRQYHRQILFSLLLLTWILTKLSEIKVS